MKTTKLNTGVVTVQKRNKILVYTEKEWKQRNKFSNRLKRFLDNCGKAAAWVIRN